MHRFAVFLVFTIVCSAPGCSVTPKSMSVDSGSRMPWLNMELMPKRKAAAPEATRISRDSSVPLEPMPAKLVKEASAKPTEDSWWQKLTGTEKRTPIKLPRTDLENAVPNKASSITAAESEPLEF